MTIQLIIDQREICCKQILSDISIEWQNLLHGDFNILINESVFAIFERKTIADLSSSIKDGRYHNQKIEMLKSYDRSKIYYIIEGLFDYATIDKTISSAIVNTITRENSKSVT